MNKFKVGDRVRYVGSGHNGVTKGDIVTVIKFDGGAIPYKVENKNKHWAWARAEDIEAIEAPATTETAYTVDTTSPIKVGDKIRILVDEYCCIAQAKVGHIFVIKALDRSYGATCDQLVGYEDSVWSISPSDRSYGATCDQLVGDSVWSISPSDRGTGWELVREVSENCQKLAEPMATLGMTADAAPAKPPRRLKYGRRRMAFEFTKALLSNPALERSYLDTPEALASVADTIALELIKRWKEVE